ncbi:MAG: hypothetical protein AAGL90_12880 [Pseudomonadota bacterium]
MVKSLFKIFKNPKKGSEILTELDITRVVGDRSSEPPVEAPKPPQNVPANIDVWKQNDLDLLQTTWHACQDNPGDEETAAAFRSALHNLHGASGAYGGGALTRLTGSLHQLVSGVEDLRPEAALINLHVQACRAASMSDGEAGDEVADSVCRALEEKVEDRLNGSSAL